MDKKRLFELLKKKIVIWRIFILLPSPTAKELSWEHIGTFLGDNIDVFLMVFIGIAVTIIYWIQNNVLIGNLQSTDSHHNILSIRQLFFLLAFLVSLGESIKLGASTGTRALESITAALVGIAGGWNWAYAGNLHAKSYSRTWIFRGSQISFSCFGQTVTLTSPR